jgi:glycosyltransferase involved in cell wall biosynthesis
MPFILNNAKVFLYPSLRESFGLPILEAMACGIPVITSNTSSMPEIANDAALIINPHNPIEIADGMKLLLTDFDYYKTLSEKGLLRAKEFSWKIMAERYLDLYLRVYMETKKQ